MVFHRIFTLLAIFHGSGVVGFTAFVFFYYAPKNKKDYLKWHIITVAASYNIITMATIITVALKFYVWGDLWYFLITIGYILGDISLFFVFKHAVKKDKNI